MYRFPTRQRGEGSRGWGGGRGLGCGWGEGGRMESGQSAKVGSPCYLVVFSRLSSQRLCPHASYSCRQAVTFFVGSFRPFYILALTHQSLALCYLLLMHISMLLVHINTGERTPCILSCAYFSCFLCTLTLGNALHVYYHVPISAASCAH